MKDYGEMKSSRTMNVGLVSELLHGSDMLSVSINSCVGLFENQL